MEISINPEEALPLVQQLVRGIQARIDDRVLRPGMRLPPIRNLAANHGISRFTVVEAYDRLVALGYLRSRRGSGFYVSERPSAAPEPAGAAAERAVDVVWLLRQAFDMPADGLRVGAGWLPPEWMDEDGLLRNLRALTRRADLNLTAYGSSLGYAPLREQLCIRLADLGIGAAAQQIVLTAGATQALDLIARHFIQPGDCVLVDDPGYWTLFGNLRLLGAQLVGVPRTADGPDVQALKQILTEHRPKVFFTHSVLHNPTAANLSSGTAHKLLKLADQHNLVIVEDDTYADFQPTPTPRLASLDQLERVIYVGSFSKTLSANLRVGFLAAHRDLAGSLTDMKLLAALPTPEFNERLVYQLLTEGHYRKYIERLQARLGEATAASVRTLERAGLALYAAPRGGMFLWARVPGVADTAPLASRAAREGIMLAPGNVFRPQMQPSPWMRFNVACTGDPRLAHFLEAVA
ncbi:MAG: PLP-dependent aminotransferase family protein [Betaproteobacteria bacterium]|nr:PLP-dependent aminotransferase family protein [Betaproteobacteria bacterium]